MIHNIGVNRRAALALPLLYAAVVAAFLASVRSHVLALHGGAPPPFNASVVHNAVARFAALPLSFPLLFLLCAALLLLWIHGVARASAPLLPDPARALPRALAAHAPLLLLLGHPLLASPSTDSLGRKLAAAALLLCGALQFLPLLPALLRRVVPPLLAFVRREAALLRAELSAARAALPGALRALPGRLLDLQPLLILTLLAFALRLYRIEERGIWWDEFAAFDWNKGSFGDLLRTVARFDSHPPLFYIVERFALQLFGFEIFVSRAVMAAASALAVPAVYALAARALGSGAAFPAALLAALSPFAVVYGQEARMYSLLLCLLAWAAVCLPATGTPREGSSGRLAAWGLFLLLALALHTHYMALPFLAAFALHPFAVSRRDRAGPVLAACAAAAFTLVPWALVARASPASADFGDYLTHWLPSPDAFEILRTPLFLLDGPFNPHGPFWVALFALPCLLPLPALLRRDAAAPARRGLALLLFAPILLEFALSALLEARYGAPIFQVKHLIGALPFALLLLVDAARRLPRPAGAALLAGLLFLQALSLAQYFQADLNTNWTAAARHLDRTVGEGDRVLCMPDLALASLQTYYKPSHASAAPCAYGPPPPGADAAAHAETVYGELAGAPRIHAVVREIGVRHGELFPRDAALLARIEREYALESIRDFDGTPALAVLRFAHRAPAPPPADATPRPVAHRLDLSRLYAYRTAVDLGLLDEFPPQTMVDGDHAKIAMAPLPDGRHETAVALPADPARFRSFHAVLDTGVKNAWVAHYFYIGESGRFRVAAGETDRAVDHRPATLRDPFVRMARDACLVLLALVSAAALFARRDPAEGAPA